MSISIHLILDAEDTNCASCQYFVFLDETAHCLLFGGPTTPKKLNPAYQWNKIKGRPVLWARCKDCRLARDRAKNIFEMTFKRNQIEL